MISSLATRLKELRLLHNLSQKALGDKVGLSMQAINNIEREYRSTTAEKLIKLADYFNVSVDYLLGRTDDPKRY
ncbi:helix-turn-helix transcriptional regulator [Sinanaerobacter sp. ZZT-01]|uniref:helix-turn-helix domain-containing protein n=1 Tax=Sinanaerobacter sp. ZZT-01 TaxID=3111540 RepID=UPI002D771265|nr:helix-turn-helix transcriptional regulator [Sinanaerobacter sp. ZZT-01]WRR94218.1 helix-turn-helix transcriptional regulator [Sinanaerobacter sp. ZZT-01]